MDPKEFENFSEALIGLAEVMRGTTSDLSNMGQGLRGIAETNKNISKEQADAQAKKKARDAENKALRKQAQQELKAASASFTSAVFSSTSNFSKFDKSIQGLSSSASNAAKSLGTIGIPIQLLIKAFEVLVGGAFKLTDQLIQFRDETVKMTGVLPTTVEEISQLSSAAGYSGENMAKLQKITAGVSQSLTSLGATAGQGAAKFMDIANVGAEVRDQFGKMGYSQEALTKMQADYLELQAQSGNAYELQTKDQKTLRKESLEYAENMARLSALTGKNADQLKKEQETAMLQYEEQIKVAQENAKIQELTAAANKAGISQEEKARLLAQATAVKNERDNRQKMIGELTNRFGPEMGAQLGRVLRTGVIDPMSKNVALVAPEFVRYKDQLGKIDPKQIDQTIETATDTVAGGIQKNAVAMGEAGQFMNDASKNMLLGSKEGLTAANKMAGKTTEERNKQFAQDKAARQADKGLSDAEQKRREEDIRMQAEMQKAFQAAAEGFLPTLIAGLKTFNDIITTIIEAALPPLKTAFEWLSKSFTWLNDHALKPFGDFLSRWVGKKEKEEAAAGGSGGGGGGGGAEASSSGANKEEGPAQSTSGGTTSADLTKMGLKLKEGDVQKPGAKVSSALVEKAKMIQSSIPGFAYFSAFNDNFHNQKASGSKHTKGEAVDFVLTTAPTAAQSDKILAKLKSMGFGFVQDEYNNPSSKATGGHIHAQLSAAAGGVFTGPNSGYPATLHGSEVIAPLNMDSILMKLAKTPAADMNKAKGTENDLFAKAMNSNGIVLEHIASKLDKMVTSIDHVNNNTKKLLQHARV